MERYIWNGRITLAPKMIITMAFTMIMLPPEMPVFSMMNMIRMINGNAQNCIHNWIRLTQTIAFFWQIHKMQNKRQGGTHRSYVHSYLCKFSWMQGCPNTDLKACHAFMTCHAVMPRGHAWKINRLWCAGQHRC